MTTENTSDALTLSGIHHAYGDVVAVQALDITVKPGEVVCLLGPSGCGKTTALRIAAGLETPQLGTVHLNGKEVVGENVFLAPEERSVGLVFQDYALFPHLTIGENVAFGIKNLPAEEQRNIIFEMLDEVGMASYIQSYPHMLSGGQQQRVALARALARNPKIILMDEPFSGLDARLRDKVRDRTLHVLKRLGSAALMVTHDAEEAMFMADRIAVMLDGALVQIGTPDELFFTPKTAFVAEFFGEVNHIIATVKSNRAITPLGPIDASGYSEGDEVEVIIRPEALTLEICDQSATGPGYAKVLASRLLGRTSLIHLCTCETTGRETHLHARIPGKFTGKDGNIFKLTLDNTQTFVFPVNNELEIQPE